MLIAVVPAMRFLILVREPVFWNEIESSRPLRAPSLNYLAYHSGVLLGDDSYHALWIERTLALECVILTSGASLRAARHGVSTRYRWGLKQ